MKRLVLIAAALILSIGAKAQLYLGGGLGLAATSRDGVTLVINPDVAYRVSHSLVVGGQFSFRLGQEGIGVVPYARWHITPMDLLFSLFVTADAPCTFYNGWTSVNLHIRPGASLRISSKLHLLAYFGAFGWSGVIENGRSTAGGWMARLDRDTINLGFTIAL